MIKEVFKKSKLFVFDMDGTIYLGNRVFPEAISFIKTLRKKGKKVLFFTNNASTNPIVYYDRLERMGFEPQEGEIMTSGDVTVSFLKKYRKGKKVFLLGTEDLKNQFVNEGITLTKDADIVVSSFDKTLTYEKLTIACTLIRNGAEFLCT
ncbi:MAG: HAD family hydrolase, partial [Firmicutes bacterium]|nr:HAD family hydrolase [Candidatus Colimorpha enterica]